MNFGDLFVKYGNHFKNKTDEQFHEEVIGLGIYVYMGYRHLTESQVLIIAELLENNHNMEKLMLSGTDLTDRGIQSICLSLHKNTRLEHLLLGSNLNEAGIGYLSEVLAKNTKLKSLTLNSNHISESAMQKFADSLRLNKSLDSLESLDNDLSDKSVMLLIDALNSNRSLTYLDIHDTLDEKTMQILFDFIASNSTLKRLSLLKQGIKNDQIKPLLECLKRNQVLTELFVRFEDDKAENVDKIDFLTQCNVEWKPENHKSFCPEFKTAVRCLTLCLKRAQKQTGVKIPRYVGYLIIKMVDKKSFFEMHFSSKKRKGGGGSAETIYKRFCIK